VIFHCVTSEDLSFLYDLLEARPKYANISHKAMPTYDEHVSFVMSYPYREWWIAEEDSVNIGAVYLTKQNEIGVSVMPGKEEAYIAMICFIAQRHEDERLLANVAPLNKEVQHAYEMIGWEVIQRTYERCSTRAR